MIEHWLTHWLTDWLSKKNYRWVHPSSLNTDMSYFHFCPLYSQQEIKFWLIHLMSLLVGLYLRMLDSHIFKRYSPFWFLDPIKHLSVQFSSLLLTGNTCFNGLFQKKRNGGIDDILSWKNLRNSLELRKTALHPLEVLRPKSKIPGNSTWFFLDHPSKIHVTCT